MITAPSLAVDTRPVGVDSVLAVLVIYERDAEATPAWPWLLRELRRNPKPGCLSLARVLVYDNSARSRQRVPAPAGVTWHHDPSNGGTAAAYAAAAALASVQCIPWMLWLDHDTGSLDALFDRAGARLEGARRSTVGALLPWVLHGDRIVSPSRIDWAGSIVPLRRGSAAESTMPLTGIASASLVSVAAWSSLGSMPSGLWLDYVDHWTFLEMRTRGWQLLPYDAEVAHDLSIAAPSTIGRSRMHSILNGEAAFVARLPRLARCVYPLRLARRLARLALRHPPGAVDLLAWLRERRRSGTVRR